MLISQGHNWSEIKQYSPQTLGAFLVAAHRIKEADWKSNAASTWIGTNVNHQGLTEVIGATKQKAKKQPQQKPVAGNATGEWLRLAAGLNGMGKR